MAIDYLKVAINILPRSRSRSEPGVFGNLEPEPLKKKYQEPEPEPLGKKICRLPSPGGHI